MEAGGEEAGEAAGVWVKVKEETEAACHGGSGVDGGRCGGAT